MYISINNTLYPAGEANISVSDLAVQRGFGIFDFLKTVNSKPVFIDDYFNRFYHSAQEMNMEVGFDRTQLRESINQLIEKNKIPNSGIKIILTGGFADDGYTMSKPNLIITQTPLEINPDPFKNPLKLLTYNHQRQLPMVKTIDYLQAIRLQSFVKNSGAEDLLYHNNGLIRECPRANFFIVTDHQIVTPKTEILKGITRSKILALEIAGYKIVERDFQLEELYTAKEAFISSSTKNAWPVAVIDGKEIGNGNFEVVKAINSKLLQLIEDYQQHDA